MKILMYIVIGALAGWFILPILAFLFWLAVALFVIQLVIHIIGVLFVLFVMSKENKNEA